jgi:hypothetical protein
MATDTHHQNHRQGEAAGNSSQRTFHPKTIPRSDRRRCHAYIRAYVAYSLIAASIFGGIASQDD